MEEDGQFATKLQKNQVLKAPIVHFAVSRGPGWMGWAMSDGGRCPIPDSQMRCSHAGITPQA